MAKSRSRSRRPAVKSTTPVEEVVTKEVVNEEVTEVATDVEEVAPEINEEQAEEEVEESAAELNEEADVEEENPYRIADEVKKSKETGRRFNAGESKDRIMDALENAVKVAREEKELAQAAGRSYRVYHMVAHRCVILIENVKRMLR